MDYRLDESYTPKQISVRAGNSFTDMTEIHAQDLEEPTGWTRIQLQTQNSLQGARASTAGSPSLPRLLPICSTLLARLRNARTRS